MKKFGFIYLWYDRKHKRYYLGSYWGTETDGYICSSNWMRDAYSRRPQDFKRRVISRIFTDRMDLYVEEERWLGMIRRSEISPQSKQPRYYNLCLGKTTHWTATEDKKTISQKVSARTKLAMQRPEVRAKYKEGLKNRNQPHDDPAYRERIRQTCLTKNLNKGMLTVRYPDQDKCFHVSPDDPRWLNGELVNAAGYKKSTRVKGQGRKKGDKHHMFTGFYHTPWGKFTSAGEAASACQLGSIHEDVIWHWCKDKQNEAFTNKGRPSKILQKEWLGKTRRDVGFYFEETV